jgi:hypothetical protein
VQARVEGHEPGKGLGLAPQGRLVLSFPAQTLGGGKAGCGRSANGAGLGGGASWAGSKSSHPPCGRRDQTINGTNVDTWSQVGPQEPSDLRFSLQRGGGEGFLGFWVLGSWPFKEWLKKKRKKEEPSGAEEEGGRMSGALEI